MKVEYYICDQTGDKMSLPVLTVKGFSMRVGTLVPENLKVLHFSHAEEFLEWFKERYTDGERYTYPAFKATVEGSWYRLHRWKREWNNRVEFIDWVLKRMVDDED